MRVLARHDLEPIQVLPMDTEDGADLVQLCGAGACALRRHGILDRRRCFLSFSPSPRHDSLAPSQARRTRPSACPLVTDYFFATNAGQVELPGEAERRPDFRVLGAVHTSRRKAGRHGEECREISSSVNAHTVVDTPCGEPAQCRSPHAASASLSKGGISSHSKRTPPPHMNVTEKNA